MSKASIEVWSQPKAAGARARLAIGTMNFGKRIDEPLSKRIIARAEERGLDFLDTANMYNDGESEKIVGRCPNPTIATRFRPFAVNALTKDGSAVLMYDSSRNALPLVSTRTAICIGSSAGTTFSTSRVTLSSRTMKSAGVKSGTGAPAWLTTLTYIDFWRVWALRWDDWVSAKTEKSRPNTVSELQRVIKASIGLKRV